MIQAIRFNCESLETIQKVMRDLSLHASLSEESGFWFFSELDGCEPFKFDCEVVSGGLITERSGEYYEFLGRFVDKLTSSVGSIQFGPEGSM